MKERVVAIVLAAGQGKRMGSAVAKQYLLIHEKPVLAYTLHAFETSVIDEVIVVVGEGEETYCREAVIERFGFEKVVKVVVGGKERYDSVYQGLLATDDADYVLIHDGARPCLTSELINTTIEKVRELKSCVLAVPVKDTIKVVNEEGIVVATPDRKQLWSVQTPQAFSYSLVYEAYSKLQQSEIANVTDDAMVVETMLNHQVHVIDGSYDNIKVTTPEDLVVASGFLKKNQLVV